MRYEVDYTPYYQTKTKSKTYKKRKDKPLKVASRAQRIGVVIIVAILCVTLLVLDDVNDVIPSTTTSTDIATTYYCVQTGVYNDRDTANYYASLEKLRNSGGYVIYDGNFHVIASIYPEEYQATAIAKRLTQGGVSASVYPISVTRLYDSTLTPNEQEALASAMTTFDTCYKELYELSNLIDQENIATGEVTTRLYSLKEFVTKQKSLVTNIQSNHAILLSACINATLELLNSLPVRPTSSELRYTYTAILSQMI